MDNEQSIIAIVAASCGIVMVVKAASPDPSSVYHGQVPGTSDPSLAGQLSRKWNDSKSGGAYFRIAFGGSLVIVVLLIMAKSQPKFAESLAWLVLIGTVFSYGSQVNDLLKKWFAQPFTVVRKDANSRVDAQGRELDPNGNAYPPNQGPGEPGYVPYDLNPQTNPNIKSI